MSEERPDKFESANLIAGASRMMSEKRSCENCGHLIGLLNPKPECERFDDQDCILNGRPNWIPMTDRQIEIRALKPKNRCPKCGSEMVRAASQWVGLSHWYCPNPDCGHEEKVKP